MLNALVLLVAAFLAGPAASPAGFVTPVEIEAALKEMPKDAKTYDKPMKAVVDKGLSHDRVTEVYQIISGSGTFESGGSMTGVEPDDLTLQAAGPSQRGDMHDGVGRHVGPGDTIIVPINLPHRFSKLDSPITYTVTRIEVPGTGESR